MSWEQGFALDTYAALSGEPALGPTAFPHRISSMPDPIAPITHHWIDSTHISFGVLTAGLYARHWKLEGSIFNGREPNEHRYDLDLGPLDSYSGRIWYLPDEHWAFQASVGSLHHAEATPGGGPRTSVTRTTVSATYQRSLAQGSYVAATGAWGRSEEHGQGSNAALGEAVLDLRERRVVFARVETAQKTASSLDISSSDAERWVAKASLGYVRQLAIRIDPMRSILLGVGAGISVGAIPSAFEDAYGERWPLGFVVFLETRPAPMDTGEGHAMPDMMPGMPGM